MVHHCRMVLVFSLRSSVSFKIVRQTVSRQEKFKVNLNHASDTCCVNMFLLSKNRFNQTCRVRSRSSRKRRRPTHKELDACGNIAGSSSASSISSSHTIVLWQGWQPGSRFTMNTPRAGSVATLLVNSPRIQIQPEIQL